MMEGARRAEDGSSCSGRRRLLAASGVRLPLRSSLVSSDLDSSASLSSRSSRVGVVHQPLLDVSRDGSERLDDVDVALGGRLEELNAVLVGKSLTASSLHNLLRQHIALVADQNLVDVVRCVLLNVADPVANVLEALLVGHVVDEQDAHGAAVVRGRDRAEALLASRIPDLQLDALSIELDRLDLEVNADGGDEARGEVNVVHGEATLKQALIKDKRFDNLYVLAASQTRDKDALTQEGVRKVLDDLIADGFEYVICDSPAGIEKGAFLAMYYADRAVVVVNPEVSSVRDSDRIIGLLDSKTHKAESGKNVPAFLLLTRYSPVRVESGEMLSITDVEEVLGLKAIGVVPESGDVLNASNKGEPVILDPESAAGQAYEDAVGRILGEERPMRFTTVEKKGFFSKLFGG